MNPTEVAASETTSTDQNAPSITAPADKKGERKTVAFWLVIVSMCLMGFTASLDGSIIAIALPEISAELASGDKYVWVANCFVLAQTVVQPAFAQICDIFGRRWPMIVATVIFAIGSSIAATASDTNILIAGRTVQGLGSGGIMLMVELIVCDLVPLKERGTYLGIVLGTAALGAILGPIVGGAIAERDWRWCFWINLPICGAVLPILVFFLRIRHHKITWSQLITRIDWAGNIIFIGSMCAILYGLLIGGIVRPWSSWHVIVPIAVGGTGWAIFHWYETICQTPCIPPRLFGNRTSASAFYMIFITSVGLQWISFFWPVYFMAVRGTTLMRTGLNFLPFMFFLIPGAAVTGILLSKTGRYRILHAIGFALSTLGTGLNALLAQRTPTGVWAIFQIIDAAGRAMILPTTLPAVLVSLSEEDVAAATGVYSFLRSFGFVWGITIPGILFNNKFQANSFKIADVAVREALGGGRAYQLATGPYIRTLMPDIQAQVIEVYLDALKIVWLAAMAFGTTGFIAVAIEKEISLRTSLETKYGLEQREKVTDQETEVSSSETAT